MSTVSTLTGIKDTKEHPPAKLSSLPKEINPAHLWSLFYRHGMNPQCSKGFYHPGDIRSAVERAKQHCERMGYRYFFVRPMICDIEAEEQQHQGL